VPTAGAPADAASATPQLPDPPASLSVPPETRDEEGDWQAYMYDVLKSNQSATPAGPPVMRTAKSTPGRRQLEAEFLDFSATHPGLLSKTAFGQKFRKEYYDDTSKTWKKKKFRQESGYEIPLDEDTGNDAPFLVPQSKLNSKVNLTGRPPLTHYQDAASAGSLISVATGREDVRQKWQDWAKASPPSGYRPAGSDGSDEEVDHIVELQVGGSNDYGNLQLLGKGDNASSGGTIRALVERHKATAIAAGAKGDPKIKWTKAIVGF